MKVAILGLGHIGGSLAKALFCRNVEICCYDSNRDTVARAVDSGLSCVYDISDAIVEADLIVLAVPTTSVLSVLKEVLGRLKIQGTVGRKVVISDVSSTKSELMDRVFESVKNASSQVLEVEYLSLHPMAGKEGSGFDSSVKELLLASTWAILLERDPSSYAVSLVMKVIGSLDGRALFVDRNTHDEAVGLISHIPHLLSFAYTQLVQTSAIRDIALPLRAGSFRDLTRVANTDPDKVAAMVVPNRSSLVALIDDFMDILKTMRSSIDSQDRFLEFASPLSNFLMVHGGVSETYVEKTLTVHGDNLNSALLQLSKEGGLVDSIAKVLDQDIFEISFSVK